jgi:hypothetical protein
VIPDRFEDVVAALADRQLGRICDRGHARAPRVDSKLGGGDLSGDLLDDGLAGCGFANLADAVEATAEPAFVAQRQGRQPLRQIGER